LQPAISYSDTHPEMRRMLRELRSNAPFVAFEVFAPPTFGAREYLDELFRQLPSQQVINGPSIFKRIKYRVEETDDPRGAAKAYLDSQLRPASSEQFCRYIIEVHNLDRRANVDSLTAEKALQGLDDAIAPFEEGLVNQAGVGLILCTQRRQRGRHPLSSGVKGSVIDRKIEMAAAVRLLTPDEASQLITQATKNAAVPERLKMIFVQATGGHPQLIQSAVDLLTYETHLTPDEHLVRLNHDATAIFNNIWENTEQYERLLLFATATIQCADLQNPIDAPSIWKKGLAKDGWEKIATVTGAFKIDLEDLRILRIKNDGKPEVFSPLFAVWLVQFAHALRIPSKDSMQDMLQIALKQEQPSYASVLEQLWEPFLGKLREKGPGMLADTILTGGVKTVSKLIVDALSG
jgi:hypothetical protein